MRTKNNKNSFTLVEMLLGISIFAIISVSLYSTFRSGIMINRRSGAFNQTYRQANLIFERITKDLENSCSYRFSNSYSSRLDFSGGAEELSFILPTKNGLKTINYRLQPPEFSSVYKVMIGKHASRNTAVTADYAEHSYQAALLVREEKPLIDALQSSAEQRNDTEILSANIKEGSLKLSYAYLEGQGESAKIVWKDSWGESYTPAKVLVKFEFVNPDKTNELLKFQKEIFIPTGFLGSAGAQN